jgi:hypothetical protein
MSDSNLQEVQEVQETLPMTSTASGEAELQPELQPESESDTIPELEVAQEVQEVDSEQKPKQKPKRRDPLTAAEKNLMDFQLFIIRATARWTSASLELLLHHLEPFVDVDLTDTTTLTTDDTEPCWSSIQTIMEAFDHSASRSSVLTLS